MTDITQQISQFTRGMLVLNSPDGIFIGGKMDGRTFHRRYSSDTMRSGDERYVRNGTILWNDDPSAGEDRYYIVYELAPQI